MKIRDVVQKNQLIIYNYTISLTNALTIPIRHLCFDKLALLLR